jgi:regulator of protease activity HflC (stomatin/prohibitin superfamily)
VIRFAIGILLVIVAIISVVVKSIMGVRKAKLERDDTASRYDINNAVTTIRIAGLVGKVGFGLGVIFILWSCVRVVPANTVGIPTDFGSIGSPLQSGLKITRPWTEIHEFPTTIQELSMLRAVDEGDKPKDDSIEVIAKGGGSMKVDLTVKFLIEKTSANNLYRQAGSIDLVKDRFIRPEAREVTRDIFGQYSAEQGYSTDRAAISQEILKRLKDRLESRGILIDSVNLRDVNPEERVLNAINAILDARNKALQAVEEQKRAITEAETAKQVAIRAADAAATKAQGEAEAIAIKAKAQAEANLRIANSLTPTLANLQAIQACADAIANSKATVINVCGVGASNATGGGSTVVIDGRK